MLLRAPLSPLALLAEAQSRQGRVVAGAATVVAAMLRQEGGHAAAAILHQGGGHAVAAMLRQGGGHAAAAILSTN